MPTAALTDEVRERLEAALRDCATGWTYGRAAVEHLVVDGVPVVLTWTVNRREPVVEREDAAPRAD